MTVLVSGPLRFRPSMSSSVPMLAGGTSVPAEDVPGSFAAVVAGMAESTSMGSSGPAAPSDGMTFISVWGV